MNNARITVIVLQVKMKLKLVLARCQFLVIALTQTSVGQTFVMMAYAKSKTVRSATPTANVFLAIVNQTTTLMMAFAARNQMVIIALIQTSVAPTFRVSKEDAVFRMAEIARTQTNVRMSLASTKHVQRFPTVNFV